ncbi:MAG TPA: amidohydrolase family protein, partial [Acidimicrobiales bacterium]|nr:amidohydrolase family protein [Acidimicrobiales bacterium]
MEPYIIVSSDTHAGLPTEQYRDYLESAYHPAFDEFLSKRDAELAAITARGIRNEKFAQAWFEAHEEELRGGWEAPQRDKELDGDGVSGEVIFPDADAVESRTCVPFGAGLGMTGDLDPSLGLAGSRAHNRWLAELCSNRPERRCGVALVPITAAIDDVLEEIRRAKQSGLGAVMIPAMWMHQTPYHDRRYDPVWALCQELEMPVVTHSGPAPKEEYGDHLGIFVSEVVWWPARPMWFLLWSGVFERFPRLKFGVTEAGCWWMPNNLWFWDRLYMGQKGAEKLAGFPDLTMLPSEYFDRNCFIGASNTKRRELGMRYEIGVDNILWGNDFPHPEGTWPATREWLKKTFH